MAKRVALDPASGPSAPRGTSLLPLGGVSLVVVAFLLIRRVFQFSSEKPYLERLSLKFWRFELEYSVSANLPEATGVETANASSMPLTADERDAGVAAMKHAVDHISNVPAFAEVPAPVMVREALATGHNGNGHGAAVLSGDASGLRAAAAARPEFERNADTDDLRSSQRMMAAPALPKAKSKPPAPPREPTAVQLRRWYATTTAMPADKSERPTRLGIVLALVLYPLLNLAFKVAYALNGAYLHGLSVAQTAIATAAMPITRPAAQVNLSLSRYGIYRFVRRYAWAVVPLLVIFTVQLDNHQYYDLFYGYDMPQHFMNSWDIMQTGTMPPPPIQTETYEAHQAPIFYVLAAWAIIIGDHYYGNGMVHFVPAVLLVVSMLWALLMVGLVQSAMRHAHWLWRALTVTFIMMLPMNIEASVMFSNDLPVIVFGICGALAMWFMLRSGRQLDRGMWLRVAALNGLSIAFKNNGLALLGAYILLALYIAWRYYVNKQPQKVLKVARLSLLALPLMLVPAAINSWHTSRYTGNPIGATTEQINYFHGGSLEFMTSFDMSYFDKPFAFGPGEGSFWTLQYASLHNDYYNHWQSKAYETWPDSAKMPATNHDVMTVEHFSSAYVLQYLAIPLTLIMVMCFFYALYRVIKFPNLGMRDASIVIVLVILVSEVAQFLRFAAYADNHAVVIHARYLGFMFPFLFIIGMVYLWKWVLRKHNLFSALVSVFLCVNIVAYCFFAMKLMWLPPNF